MKEIISEQKEVKLFTQIRNDEEYSYLLGQIATLINNVDKKKNSIGYIGKYTDSNTRNINLINDLKRCNYTLSEKVIKIINDVINYVPKQLNKGKYLAGALDNNFLKEI